MVEGSSIYIAGDRLASWELGKLYSYRGGLINSSA